MICDDCDVTFVASVSGDMASSPSASYTDVTLYIGELGSHSCVYGSHNHARAHVPVNTVAIDGLKCNPGPNLQWFACAFGIHVAPPTIPSEAVPSGIHTTLGIITVYGCTELFRWVCSALLQLHGTRRHRVKHIPHFNTLCL